MKEKENENAQQYLTSNVESSSENEIILYQPDSTLTLEVKVENETVWLSQSQMAVLFDKDQSVIARHISNIFKEEELGKDGNMQILHNTLSKYKPTQVYSLDVIISVGYRVKSKRGTMFRQWANKILKEHLLRGYSINQRLLSMENRIDNRLSDHDMQIKELKGSVDLILKTSLPPREGVLYEGQIFDAYVFVCNLIRRAKKRIVLVDNYIDETVLVLLNKRNSGVIATIYTKRIDRSLQLDIERHGDQYTPIDVRTVENFHDRFLIIDETLYHIGASIKDLGRKLFAFSKMDIGPEIIIDRL